MSCRLWLDGSVGLERVMLDEGIDDDGYAISQSTRGLSYKNE